MGANAIIMISTSQQILLKLIFILCYCENLEN